jgi:hypothetical protein
MAVHSFLLHFLNLPPHSPSSPSLASSTLLRLSLAQACPKLASACPKCVPLKVWLRLATAKLAGLSNVVTAWAVVCCEVINELQSLSELVTADPNARLEGVGSFSRARGLQQKPALPSWSHQRQDRAGSSQGG